MKVLYSQLKKYLPDLKADAKEVAAAYTLTGFMIDKMLDVEFDGKKDYLLDLEVRQNRADAFGVIGLARELSAFYNIPLKKPVYPEVESSGKKLPIEVLATKAVKRVMAVEITDLKISQSPKWLKDYLALYEINSINNLVDITNYVMLETGHANHAFDVDKVGEKLVWEINPKKYKKITTLNGEEIELSDEALVVSDGKRPLALCLVGGKDDAVDNNTKNIIVEVAVYDGGLVRRNSRQMKIMTEAGSRLEKFMDPDSVPDALNMLVAMIKEYCGGETSSEVYDNYPKKTEKKAIEVNLDKVQQVAGIEISYEESKTYLKRLEFEIIEDNGNIIKVLKPVNRLDIEGEQDVFEEIIRLKGFNLIPADNLTVIATKEITPSYVVLMENIQYFLVNNGLDEVRSWVLVDEKKNKNANFGNWKEIRVTNSINEEVPYLRQSIAVSLFGQIETYKKNNIPFIKLFEVGKIFGKTGKGNTYEDYSEINSLGIAFEGNDINELKLTVEKMLRSFGLDDILYKLPKTIPLTAHPKTIWDIYINETKIGIIYLSNTNLVMEAIVSEIDLDIIDKLIIKTKLKSTFEVSQKIVELDTNVNLKETEDINSYLVSLLSKYKDSIWSWEITDKYKNNETIKYTVRIYYVNMSDQDAKKLHTEIFN